MKKYVLFMFAAISIASVSQAQSFKFGPKLGANMGKIQGKGFSDQYTLGYHVGAFTEIGLGKKWAIQPEILWNQINADTVTGFKAIYQNISTQATSSNVKLNYLSIPLLLTYKPTKILSIQAGPQFGILIDKDKTLIANGKDAFKNGDLSMLVGAQLNILRVRLYGRYVIGLNNINDLSSSEKWTNQGIQLGAGFAF